MANTKASLTQQNTQTYPSNTSGSITANAVKSFNNNFINAVATLGDTNVFTEPQTFGNTVQVNSNVTANNFVGNLIGTASVALTALTASYLSGSITNAVSASYAAQADNAILFDGKARSTFATTGSNTFNGTNTFSGSVNIQSASIQFLTVDTIVSSSTIFSSGSNTLGDAAGDVQTLFGTVDVKTGPLLVTGSVSSTGGFTGSLQGTASFADNSTSASFALTASFAQNAGVPTGSFATTGSNVFSGSQTFNTASLILNTSGSNPLFSNFTQSISGQAAYGNILGFFNTAFSSSVIFSGSRNIGFVSPINNTLAATTRGGGNYIGNYGILGASYSTASAPAVMNNNMMIGALVNSIPNTSSVITFGSNFLGGTVTVTGSGTANVNMSANSVDSITINNSWTGSGAGQNIAINNNIIKSVGGTFASLIDFGGATTNANSRQFNQNLLFGIQNTASLAVNGLNTVSNLLNTSIIGSNLIVSGTMNTNSTSASMFVGQFNETGSVADASLVKFAVGSGTTNAARKTPFYVSQSGDVVIRANGDGQGLTQFSPNRITRVADGNLNGSLSTVAAANAVFNVNQVNNSGLQLCSIISSDGSANINASANAVIIAGNANQMQGGSLNLLSGNFTNMTASFNSNVLGGQSNTMSASLNSTILGGSNIRMNASTASVALGRDAAYTASANYTLFTQNIQASGSVGVTGSVNATSFTGSLSGDFRGTAQVSGTLGFTGSLLGYIDANHPLIVNFGDNTVTSPGNNGRNFTFGTAITQASANNGAAFGESHNMQNPSYNSFIGGGNGNTMNANKAFIGGGTSNQVTAVEGAVIGGSSNSVSHQASVILGGSGMSSTQTNEVTVPHLVITGSLKANGNIQYNYGSYFTTASISLTANTSQSLNFTTVDAQSGFTLSGSNNEQIKATNAGVYNLQFSAQLDQGANSANYYIWLKKNGSNVSNTAGKVTLATNHSDITSWNYVVSLAANDTLELVIQSDANNSSVAYIAASGNIPAAPSVIATITQVR